MTDHKNKNGKKKAALALLLLFLFGSVTTYTAVRFLNPAKDSNIIASDSTLQAPQDITDESVPLAAPQVTENETEDTLVSTLPSQTMEPETQPPVSEILSSAPVQQITSHTQNNDNNDVPPVDNGQNNDNNNVPPADNGQNNDNNNVPPADNEQNNDNNDVPPVDNEQNNDNNDVPPIDNGQNNDNNNVPPVDNEQNNDNNDVPPIDNGQNNDNNNVPPADNEQNNNNNDVPPADNEQNNDNNDVPPIDNEQNNDNNDVPPADNEQNNNNNDSNSVVWNEETILAKAREMMETISTMTAAEKQEYFGIKNNNFSNDTFRDKLLSFIGEGWPTIDSQILAETQNLQNSTLYISCYFAGNKTPILFGSLYNDNTKNWNTNMIYVNGTWYEYVEKTPWGKIKGFKMTSLKSQADVEALTEMLTSIEEANGIWNPINVK